MEPFKSLKRLWYSLFSNIWIGLTNGDRETPGMINMDDVGFAEKEAMQHALDVVQQCVQRTFSEVGK